MKSFAPNLLVKIPGPAGLLFLLLLFTTAQAAEKKKIIFDTDLGGDIDDAFAHALVQISPEFEVLGITVADGPTRARARASCSTIRCRLTWSSCSQAAIVPVGRPFDIGCGSKTIGRASSFGSNNARCPPRLWRSNRPEM